MALQHSLSKICASLMLASGVVAKSIGSSPAVSLLFQNDGNWTNYAEKPSALLFYDSATYDDALATCKAYNETLLDSSSLHSFVPHFPPSSFTINLEPILPQRCRTDNRYWISPSNRTTKYSCSAPLISSTLSPALPTEKLPFLCTNSALHTTKVDTDFSASPRNSVISKGVVYTGYVNFYKQLFDVHLLRITADRTRDHLTFRFMGIPYAQPPTGSLRLQNPQPWNGTAVDATFFKPVCLQYGYFGSNDYGLMPWGNSEDCLNLHQVRPALKPVLFWIHGGGNTQGAGADTTFDGGSLVSRTDSEVVTIDHRLNIFGYLGLDDAVKGNYAIADKVAALQWVKENIAVFGSDPKPTGVERLACLQSLPAETLLNITNSVTTWEAVDDGIYTVNDTISQLSQAPSGVNSVPYMAGFMPEEGQSLLGTSISPNMTIFNPSSVVGAELTAKITASGLWNISESFTPYNATINIFTDVLLTCPAEEMITAAAAAKTFPYVYEMQRGYALSYYNPYGLCSFPVGDNEPDYYRCHSGDLYEASQVFGTYYIFNQPIRNVHDIEYTTMIQDMWVSFARTGNPNPSKMYLKARGYDSTLKALEHWTWPQYTSGKPLVAQLQYPGLSTGTLPDIARCKVLDS
ncbi:Alpha/Beta hydrolase protein [Mycena sp. CBHHK59/15]|nr:Alpha/Beta hydrolase protein [Mycena sp. CBHHK59/15]